MSFKSAGGVEERVAVAPARVRWVHNEYYASRLLVDTSARGRELEMQRDAKAPPNLLGFRTARMRTDKQYESAQRTYPSKCAP